VIALLREQARGLAEELALVDREMDRAYEALRPAGAAGSNGGEAAPAPGEPEAAAEPEDGAPEKGGDDSGAFEAGPGERGPAGYSTPSTGGDAGEGTGSAPPEADADAGEGTGSASPSAGDAAEATGASSAPGGDAAPGEAPDGPAADDPPAPSERI
jgi:hypothetical protein